MKKIKKKKTGTKKPAKKNVSMPQAIKVIERAMTKQAGYAVTAGEISFITESQEPTGTMPAMALADASRARRRRLVCKFRNGVFSCEWE